MKHVIKFTLYRERPATQADVDESVAWHEKHPGAAGAPFVLGEMIDAEDEMELPACWEICQRCKGNGSHTNPSIDGNGITSDEWNGPDWDDEEKEMYLSGGYDIACEANCTNGKVLEVDEELCKLEPLKSLLEAYDEQEDERARDRAADRRTAYMESGGSEGSWH